MGGHQASSLIELVNALRSEKLLLLYSDFLSFMWLLLARAYSWKQKVFIMQVINVMESIKAHNRGNTFSKEKATIINCLNMSIRLDKSISPWLNQPVWIEECFRLCLVGRVEKLLIQWLSFIITFLLCSLAIGLITCILASFYSYQTKPATNARCKHKLWKLYPIKQQARETAKNPNRINRHPWLNTTWRLQQ